MICADDKVAKRPHATRRLSDDHEDGVEATFAREDAIAAATPSSSLFLDSEKNGCGDGAFIGDAVGRDVGMYVGTLFVGTLVGV